MKWKSVQELIIRPVGRACKCVNYQVQSYYLLHQLNTLMNHKALSKISTLFPRLMVGLRIGSSDRLLLSGLRIEVFGSG